MPKTLREQIEGKCVHFNGVMNKTCEACVSYDEFRVPTDGPYKFPCFRENESLVQCEKREWPTPESVQERIDEIERSHAQVMKASAAVRQDAEKRGLKKGNGGTGEVKCPCCDGGTVHYSISGYNGHAMVRCTTDDCVAWME